MNTIANVTYVDFQNRAVSPARRSDPVRRPPPVETDALVERMVLGDGVAIDELKRRYGKRLIAVATDALNGDEEEATLVVDRVFDEASFGWPPERGQVVRWLTRLVRRAARARCVQLSFDA